MTPTQHASLARFWAKECLPAFAKADDLRWIAKRMIEDRDAEIERFGEDAECVRVAFYLANARATLARAKCLAADAEALWVNHIRSVLGNGMGTHRYAVSRPKGRTWVVDGAKFEPGGTDA